MFVISDQRLEKIDQMPQAKREALLAAAMAELCRGYKNAATEAMASAAGVSKGLLFHYFGDKRTLLHYTAQAAMEAVSQDFLAAVNFEEGDLFRRLWRITSIRFDLMARYPAIFDFLTRLATVQDDDFAPVGQALAARYPEVFPLSEDSWYGGIDHSLFREGLDVQRAVRVVRWTFGGYAAAMERPWETGRDPREVHQQALKELWDYISFFRKQFYRPL